MQKYQVNPITENFSSVNNNLMLKTCNKVEAINHAKKLKQTFKEVSFNVDTYINNECNKIDLSELDLKHFETYGQKNQYILNFINHLNTLTKDRQKTAEIYKKLLEINKLCQ